ncbi:MAG TPA: hypothetical protein PLS66_01165, partial [Tepiditoga sp.]|nr:hypothetical protein [Tepiditoga sp.]
MKNKRFLNLIVVFFKDTFKNKAEVFFTLLFPVLFLVIFGFVFGSMADDETIENYTFAVYGTSDESIKEYFAPDNVIFYSDYKEME